MAVRLIFCCPDQVIVSPNYQSRMIYLQSWWCSPMCQSTMVHIVETLFARYHKWTAYWQKNESKLVKGSLIIVCYILMQKTLRLQLYRQGPTGDLQPEQPKIPVSTLHALHHLFLRSKCFACQMCYEVFAINVAWKGLDRIQLWSKSRVLVMEVDSSLNDPGTYRIIHIFR